MIKKLVQLDPEPPWTSLVAVGVVIAAFLTLVIGASVSQVAFSESPTVLIEMTGWSIGTALTAILVLNLLRRTEGGPESLRIDPTASSLPVVFVFGLGMAGTFDLISWIVIGDKTLAAAELVHFDSAIAVSGWLMALLFMGLFQPVAEELVFRGVLFPALRFSLGAWSGLVICAAFYAAFHLAAYLPGSVSTTVFIGYGLALPFAHGLLLGGVRAYTGSTRAAMVAHAALGVFAVFKVWVVTSA
jgi:membrane protease YdiL (CAAX protease family)